MPCCSGVGPWSGWVLASCAGWPSYGGYASRVHAGCGRSSPRLGPGHAGGSEEGRHRRLHTTLITRQHQGRRSQMQARISMGSVDRRRGISYSKRVRVSFGAGLLRSARQHAGSGGGFSSS